MGPRFIRDFEQRGSLPTSNKSRWDKRKDGMVMGDMAILVIWFASIVAGMILTLLMPVMFADSRVKEATQDERAH
jgi:hypothetical protein